MAGAAVVLGLLAAADQPAEATDPVGVQSRVLGRATVPAFDAIRRYREAVDPDRRGSRNWKIELEATNMIDIITVEFTVFPGGHGGWHTHPGPALFTVLEGTLTMYDGDDPSCTAQVFPAGTGSVEADTSEHIHITRNETNSIVRTLVTFLVPVNTTIPRIDLPNPGNCPF
jgi:mannose-6-phosphate isomerase-like protein (cupin superfamily)